MKIVAVEAIPIAVPLRTPLRMAVAIVERRECILVRLRTDDGVVGVGEGVLARYFTGESLASAMDLVEGLFAPALLGQDPFNLECLGRELDRLTVGNEATKAAVDIALHDLVARGLGVPLYQLLGGKSRDRVPTIWHVSNGDPDRDADEAGEAVRQGFRLIKLKVGTQHRERELQSVAAVREAIGGDVGLVLDANQGWSPENAIRFIRQAEPARPLFIEQPVHRSDVAGMARVAAAVDAPIAGDEGVFNASDLLLYARLGAADAVVAKMIKAGGVGGVRKLAAVADAGGIGLHLAGMPGQTSISAAAEIHLAAALPRLEYGTGISPHYATDDVVETPLRPVEGMFSPPEGPGVGIELSEEAIERLRVR